MILNSGLKSVDFKSTGSACMKKYQEIYFDQSK